MVLLCTRTNFLSGLAFAEHAIGKNPALPILSTILLTARTGKLVFSATDLTIAITISLPAKTDGEGTWAIPFRTLSGFVATITEETLQLKPQGKTLTIKAGSFQGKIRCANAEEFPIIPTVKQKEAIVLPAEAFVSAVEGVLPAVSVTETRPELSGVAIIGEGNQVTVAATDTFRLAVRTFSYKGEEPFSIILPQKTAQEVTRLFPYKKTHNKETAVRVATHQCTFENNDIALTSRLVEGKFPDFRAIVPKGAVTTVHISKTALLHSLEAAGFFSGRLNDVHINLPQKGNILSIYAENPDIGSYETEVPAMGKEGEAQSTLFNLRYLLDAIRGFPHDALILRFHGEQKPLLIQPEEKNEQGFSLVMPIRANA